MKTELIVHAVHQGAMRVLASDGDFRVAMDYPIVDRGMHDRTNSINNAACKPRSVQSQFCCSHS